MQTHALLFDLDGTLTDPKPGITRSIQFALTELKRPAPSEDELAIYIGPPLRKSFAYMLETDDSALIEEALRLYRVRYGDIGLFENQVYPGIPELLASAQQAGKRLFVATAKPRQFAQRILDHFALSQYFDVIYGAEFDGRFDNKADLLAHLFATEGIDPASAVMIGDRDADIKAAKANGVASIGVLWGYGPRAELEAAGADAICATPKELAQIVLA